MSLRSLFCVSVAFSLDFASVNRTQAQTEYLADAQAVVSTGNLVLTNRLYVSPGTLAPTNTAVWFVADTARNGVSTNPPMNRILGPDDVLIRTDVVDGTLLGNQPGRYSRLGIVVSNIVSTNAEIYVYLWNGQGASFQPQAGSTFGLFRIGIAESPAIGNASWFISADVVATQYQVGNPVVTPPSPLIQFVVTNATLQLSFPTVAGAVYQVQSTTNLSSTPVIWLNESDAIAGNGSGAAATMPLGVAGQKFFRVLIP